MKFALRSIVLSMNLLERKWSPRPIPPPSWLLLLGAVFNIFCLDKRSYNEYTCMYLDRYVNVYRNILTSEILIQKECIYFLFYEYCQIQ